METRNDDADIGDGLPSAVGDGQLHGPNIGLLCVLQSGTRVRVTGRAWDFFDDSDLIEVTIEGVDGDCGCEEISLAQFLALEASARLVL
jgi:hypothetical protein